jgi:hypothetical protein
MDFKHHCPLAALLLLGTLAFAEEPGALVGKADTGTERYAFLELYSSQGCSSCPAADDVVRGLGAKGFARVVVAAFHVDYWDRLGWKDPFARAEWSKRQIDRAKAHRSPDYYTPQLVVDGLDPRDAKEELAAALTRALAQPARAQLGLEARLEKSLTVSGHVTPLGKDPLPAGLVVEALLLEDSVSTEIERGENGGRTLVEEAVVRACVVAAKLERPVGARTAFKATLPAPAGRREHLRAAVVLRDPKTHLVHQALDVALVASAR